MIASYILHLLMMLDIKVLEDGLSKKMLSNPTIACFQITIWLVVVDGFSTISTIFVEIQFKFSQSFKASFSILNQDHVSKLICVDGVIICNCLIQLTKEFNYLCWSKTKYLSTLLQLYNKILILAKQPTFSKVFNRKNLQ